MATFGMNLWTSGEMNPSNFAANGTHQNAIAGNNTQSNQRITDAFIGAPLATNSPSPPAGPVENSLRGMEGWKGMPLEGKVLMPLAALGTGWAIAQFPAFNGHWSVQTAGSIIAFIYYDSLIKARRAA